MAERKIIGALAMPDGTVFRAGREDQLLAAAQVAKMDLSAFVGEGSSDLPLRGEWSAKVAPSSSTGTAPYPDNFPGRGALEKAGVKSAADAQKMTKPELVALDNIGEKTADEILAFGK